MRDYDQAITSAHWFALKDQAMARSGGRCEGRRETGQHYDCEMITKRCGAVGPLQMHHKHYRTLGRETLDDVEMLCDSCHRSCVFRSFPDRRLLRLFPGDWHEAQIEWFYEGLSSPPGIGEANGEEEGK
jgi:hypothetical protein